MLSMRIDLHVHSSVSDGTDTPTGLVLNARQAGLDVIGLCDHDTFDGIAEATATGQRMGVTVLPGLEMSTNVAGTAVHLLGYGCDPHDDELLSELARLRQARAGRLGAFLDKLDSLGMPLTEDEVMDQVGLAPSIGRPHLADAMVARGYVKDRKEAFDRYLSDGGPAYVKRYSTPLPEAIRLIRKAKGVTVLAHPWGRGSARVLTGEVIANLAEQGLDGVEVDHTDHDPRAREMLGELGFRTGLIRTGSSDYHGDGKPDNPLGINTTRPSAYKEILRRISARGGTLPR